MTIDAVEERNMDLGPTVRIVGSVKTPNLEEILDVDPDLVIMSADIDEMCIRDSHNSGKPRHGRSGRAI